MVTGPESGLALAEGDVGDCCAVNNGQHARQSVAVKALCMRRSHHPSVEENQVEGKHLHDLPCQGFAQVDCRAELRWPLRFFENMIGIGGFMAAIAPVPLNVYLRTSYEPDAEYVDGEIEMRPMGEYATRRGRLRSSAGSSCTRKNGRLTWFLNCAFRSRLRGAVFPMWRS